MLVIKNYIIDSDKIRTQIQENKLKEPKKQGKISKKVAKMEQQEAHESATKKNNQTKNLVHSRFLFKIFKSNIR
jgi:hypothetical protein